MGRGKRSFAQEYCVKNVGLTLHRAAMLWPGARIGIALSGGVDSFVLAKTLAIRKGILPFRIELMALHVNPGFVRGIQAPLLPWLGGEGIPAHIEEGEFGMQAAQESERTPCFRCAWLRRKRLFELCAQYRLTHLAFGHNAEDMAETFFLNLCRNGRVAGMKMRESFFGGKLMVIRPLLLTEKKYIRQAARQWDLPVFSNPCHWAGRTARSAMAETLNSLYSVSRHSRRCIINGLARWELARYENMERPETNPRK